MFKTNFKDISRYQTVGMMFPASIIGGLVIGYFLDKWLHTSPYLAIIFTLYGVAAGFVNLFKLAKKPEQKPEDSLKPKDSQQK